MRPVLKAPGSIIFKLRYDGLLSKFAFNFILRRYNEVVRSLRDRDMLSNEELHLLVFQRLKAGFRA
jgi:hypothetical protein